MPADNLVDIEDLHFTYDGRPVLQGIDMKIPRGKVVAIMGGSGCGKTTLLRCIGGQLKATRGEIRLGEHRISQMGHAELYRVRRKMGMLFQFGALFTDISVFDNVAFPLREHTDLSESMIRDLVLMKLEAVGLRGAAQFRTSELSGGMARRVALARAIALDPPLIMYDEPFAGLDPVALATVAQLIRRLNDALDCASIVVSHDIKDAFAIADHVFLLAGGRIAAQGTPDEMKASDDPNVRQFLEGDIDGPIAFHFQAKPLAEDLGLGA